MQLDLPLDRDIVFFDVETTGLHVLRDRILQIGLIKFPKGGGEGIELQHIINPGIPISDESYGIHGIGPEEVRNKPTFSQLAQEIYDFIGDADLGGYNCARFDIPMLMEEFDRAGFDFDIEKRRIIDVQRIFYKMEPRTLAAAYKYYCNNRMDNAHDAMVDVRATAEVLNGQLSFYEGVNLYKEDEVIEEPIKKDIQALHEFSNDLNIADVTRKLRYEPDGTLVFNFGQHINKPVGETLYNDRNYLNWILNKDFSVQVKKLAKKAVKEYEASQNNSNTH